jgi:hypothetical protein
MSGGQGTSNIAEDSIHVTVIPSSLGVLILPPSGNISGLRRGNKRMKAQKGGCSFLRDIVVGNLPDRPDTHLQLRIKRCCQHPKEHHWVDIVIRWHSSP